MKVWLKINNEIINILKAYKIIIGDDNVSFFYDNGDVTSFARRKFTHEQIEDMKDYCQQLIAEVAST